MLSAKPLAKSPRSHFLPEGHSQYRQCSAVSAAVLGSTPPTPSQDPVDDLINVLQAAHNRRDLLRSLVSLWPVGEVAGSLPTVAPLPHPVRGERADPVGRQSSSLAINCDEGFGSQNAARYHCSARLLWRGAGGCC